MNKEEILAKARKENNGIDEVKRSVEGRSSKISRAVGVCACGILTIIDSIFSETGIIGSVCWIIYGSIISSDLWVHVAYLKKPGYLIGALLATGITVVFAILLFVGYKNA